MLQQDAPGFPVCGGGELLSLPGGSTQGQSRVRVKPRVGVVKGPEHLQGVNLQERRRGAWALESTL